MYLIDQGDEVAGVVVAVTSRGLLVTAGGRVRLVRKGWYVRVQAGYRLV